MRTRRPQQRFGRVQQIGCECFRVPETDSQRGVAWTLCQSQPLQCYLPTADQRVRLSRQFQSTIHNTMVLLLCALRIQS